MCSVLETLKASEPDYKSYSRRVEKYINKKLDDLQFERHSLTATKSKLERALRRGKEYDGILWYINRNAVEVRSCELLVSCHLA